jgi:hypothetical protein
MCLAISKPPLILGTIIIIVWDLRDKGGGRWRVRRGWMKSGEDDDH